MDKEHHREILDLIDKLKFARSANEYNRVEGVLLEFMKTRGLDLACRYYKNEWQSSREFFSDAW